MNDFCETLKERRKRVGLSQNKIAARTGLSIQTVRHIEQCKIKRPHKFTVDAINAVLDEAEKELETVK